MKRVSLKIGKALKRAGFPQSLLRGWAYIDGELVWSDTIDLYLREECTAPLIMEAWLWLWEKGICIEIKNNHYYTLAKVNNERFHGDTPEEAIIAAIEYLVDNDLIK